MDETDLRARVRQALIEHRPIKLCTCGFETATGNILAARTQHLEDVIVEALSRDEPPAH